VKKRFVGFIVVGLLGAALGLAYLLHDDSGSIKSTYASADAFAQKGQAMVPWRTPQADMAAFFPGAPLPDSAATKVISLAAKRTQIMKRLGKETPLDSNALYVYPVPGEGAVLLRRAAGEFGGIEVVLGIAEDGKVVGVRLQRHREPPEIERFLTSPSFLDGFVGKTSQSELALPTNTPTMAQKSALAVLRSVRALLIEYDAGTRP
jgi:hypothetical protein